MKEFLLYTASMKTKVSRDCTLLEALGELSPGSSVAERKEWIAQERVEVGGQRARRAASVVPKGTVVFLGPRRHFLEEGIEILYEDRDLVVIDKPPGLLSVATEGEDERTAHAILKRKKRGMVYPVHRLDRETSGVMIFAYTPAARAGLKTQFETHTITRSYFAFLEGEVLPASGSWRSHLVEEDDCFVYTSPKGKLAITHYEVVQQRPRYAAVRLTLETGRKNQIRVHAAEAGHPVVGDRKYGPSTLEAPRLYLHAERLEFRHPISGKKLSFFRESSLVARQIGGRRPIPERLQREGRGRAPTHTANRRPPSRESGTGYRRGGGKSRGRG